MLARIVPDSGVLEPGYLDHLRLVGSSTAGQRDLDTGRRHFDVADATARSQRFDDADGLALLVERGNPAGVIAAVPTIAPDENPVLDGDQIRVVAIYDGLQVAFDGIQTWSKVADVSTLPAVDVAAIVGNGVADVCRTGIEGGGIQLYNMPSAYGIGDSVFSRLHFHLGNSTAYVVADRSLGTFHLRCSLFHALSIGKHLEDAGFCWGERGGGILVGQDERDCGADPTFPCEYRLQCMDDDLHLFRLENVPLYFEIGHPLDQR